MQKGKDLFFKKDIDSCTALNTAFSLVELIFVLIVAGILSATMVLRFDRNSLREAADEIVSYLRYTKHLAMIDDKFSLTDPLWFKGRWQLKFVKNRGSKDNWSCTIFSDWKGKHTGNPDKDEIAKNPIDPNRYLTGGTSGNALIQYDSPKATKELNIGLKYGIENVKFKGGCRSNVRYISFDYLGRAFNSFPKKLPYELSSRGYHKLITSTCKIVLCSDMECSKNITIAIEPETGYIHII